MPPTAQHPSLPHPPTQASAPTVDPPPTRPTRFKAQALDKLMYLAQPLHDRQCRCVVFFDGRLDASRLARAVEISLDLVPVLGCRYVLSPWQNWWERSPVPRSQNAFSLVCSSAAEPAIQAFLAAPMEPTQSPQARVCLIRSDVDTVGLMLNHMATDASGTLDYLRLLGQVYRQLTVDPHYAPPVAGGDRGSGQVLRRAGLGRVLKGLLHFRYPRSAWGFPAVSADHSGRAFLIRRLEQARTTRLKAHCRERSATFSDLLLAAFYRALTTVLIPATGKKLPVQLTVDLRRYLPSQKADTLCNLAGVCYPAIRPESSDSFDQTLDKVRAVTARAQATHPWLGSEVFLKSVNLLPAGWQAALARSVIRREMKAGRAHPFFANLGVIDPTVADFGDVAASDLILYGPVAFPPNFLVTVQSFRETLTVTTSFCDTAADPVLVDRFMDAFVAELPE